MIIKDRLKAWWTKHVIADHPEQLLALSAPLPPLAIAPVAESPQPAPKVIIMASWLDQFLKSVFGGAVGAVPATHSDGSTNPVHAVVDSFNQAGAALGATAANVAESEVTSIVTKYAGGETGLIAAVLLQAVISAAQAKLSAVSPTPTPPTPALVVQNTAQPQATAAQSAA
jgi:hypothetical protein